MKKISAIEMAMKLVGGKYKCLILYHLSSGAKRTRDLLSLLDGISPKVLTEQLRQLEADGLVSRATFAEVPPRVEYALTDEGRTFVPAGVAAAVRLGLGIRPTARADGAAVRGKD